MRRLHLAGLALSLILLSGCISGADAVSSNATGYLDAVSYRQGFLAVGTEGRMDIIGLDGKSSPLTTNTAETLIGVAVDDDQAAAVGGRGLVLLLSPDGTLSDCSPVTVENLYSCFFFAGSFLAGSDGGIVLSTGDFRTWQTLQLPIGGTVTGLAANDERCIAVTDQGETAATTDGSTWTILDYNDYYGQNVTFQGIESCGNTFWAYGADETGAGRILITLEGGVWSDRTPLTEAEMDAGVTPPAVTNVCWDGQQAYVPRPDGNVLTMPSCTQCNILQTVSEVSLMAAACNGHTLLFAGQGVSIHILDTQETRQSDIKPQAALEKQQNGALFIDVRTAEEYAEKHIAGSIHLDVAAVAGRLQELSPDRTRELIFYCKSGKRSQTALETAISMDYENVYNLGGIDDWPYEFDGQICRDTSNADNTP